MDEDVVTTEGDLMTDSVQFGDNGDESRDGDRNDEQFLMRQKHENLPEMDDLAVNIKDSDTVTYIETTENESEDPLSLQQMCVPAGGVNMHALLH